ncbi:cytochrome c biogenesis protein ResB [Geomonas sp. Red276]
MLKTIYQRLTSLNLGLWLLTALMVALALGSFSPGGGEESRLNDLPLLIWLRHAPLSYSWWLWLAVALVAVLSLNAILCSIEALRRKGRSIAPHLMHLGFLLIAVAHLVSAYGGMKDVLQVGEGTVIGFPDREQVRVERISGETGEMGMPISYRAELRFANGEVGTTSPNHPCFHKGFGIYVKQVDLGPMPMALMEIHREPGALPALAGGLLFTLGNLMLLA